MKNLIISYLFVVVSLAANQARGQTLKGSPASVKKQYTLAQTYGFKFIQTSGEVATTVKSGKLHRVSAGPYLELHNVPPTGMAVDLRIPAKRKCRSWEYRQHQALVARTTNVSERIFHQYMA